MKRHTDAPNKFGKPVASQGTDAMASVPKKIANKAGSTATATSLTGFLNMADEK